MTWLKRMAFFGMVNIGIMVTLSIVLNLLGIMPRLQGGGINYQSLMIMCLLWGTGGAFISLWISKWMAKRFYGVQIIDNHPQLNWLVQMVHQTAKAANLPVMPEVGVFQSPEINAFATGPSKSNSLVAVSSGLLEKLDRDEIEGVIGHEVAHIANGDMVTMTLIQGIMNAFVMFLARIVAGIIDNFLSGDEEGGSLGFFGYIFTVMALEMVFGLLGQVVTSYFSRVREFAADRDGARLVGRQKMTGALQALRKDYSLVESSQNSSPMAAMQISNKSKFLELLSSHPPLEKRIQVLQNMR